MEREDQNDDQPDDFDQRLTLYGRFRGWFDEAEAVEDGEYAAIATKLSDDDRGSPEAKGLLEELTQRDEATRKEAEEAEQQRLAADREQRKAQLKADREQAAREAADKDRQADLDAELSAELDQESGEGPTGPSHEDNQLAAFQEAHEAHAAARASGDMEAAYQAAQRGIKIAASLERASDEAPVDFDPDEFLATFNASREGR